jgi:predicted Zn-dependent peptidase
MPERSFPTVRANSDFFRYSLPGGAVLVGERVPARRSVALGIWIGAGSRDEDAGREGAAHFVEHLVFKGTRRRSAREIATAIERVGGSLEAFTTKENTCFYARVLREHAGLAWDVLSDLITAPQFAEEEIERERQVVLEELRSLEDAPEDLVGDLAMARLWPGHIMGASILGTEASLSRLDAETVRGFHRRAFRLPRIVVSLVGAVEPEDLLEAVERDLAPLAGSDSGAGELPPRTAPPTGPPGLTVYPRETTQTHVSLFVDAPARDHPDRRPAELLAEILGGGMSSRLFQSIREDLGLAYSVYGYSEHFADCGTFGTSFSVTAENAAAAVDRACLEYARFLEDGPARGELDAAKAQARGEMIMGSESLTERMLRLADIEERVREYESMETRLARYDAVTEEDLMRVAAELLDPGRQRLIALGSVEAAVFGDGFSTVDVVEAPP